VFTRLIWYYLPCLLLSGLLASVLKGQIPLQNEQSNRLGEDQRLVLEWKKDAADRLLQSGLSGLAGDLYQKLLQTPGLAPQEVADLQIQLARALIAQRQFVSARELLEKVSIEDKPNAYYLYLAISAYGNGRKVDSNLLENSLQRVDKSALPPEDLPWFYLLKGLAAELSEQLQTTLDAFKQARAAALSDTQRAVFDALILREELSRTPTDEALIKNVYNQWRRLSGTAAAYPFVRQYVIILYNQGKVEEAIEMINQELTTVGSGYSNKQREQLLLLKGVLYGVNTLSGRDTLRALLREGKNREVLAIALQLLADASKKSKSGQAELVDFLGVLIAREEPHPLLGQLYYLRSQIALERGEVDLAETDAKLLLEQFPGLSKIVDVYNLLAYAALQKNPPQYRAAADFLIQVRDLSETPVKRQRINRLIGDCYFLNEDYRNAVDFYQLALAEDDSSDNNKELFLRLITAAVRSGQIDLALKHLDETDFDPSIPVADKWQAEWNVALALQADGQLETALARLRLLLDSESALSMPAALDLRLRWLEIRLTMLLSESDAIKQRLDELSDRIESIPEDALESAELELLRTEVLLLKAKYLISTGESAAGIELLQLLRSNFAKSSAAEQSFLIEASYYASIGNLKAAQEMLLKLVADYKSSSIVPQALYEAGIYGERLGPDHFAKAVRILDDLAERFPNDPLYFFARLKQGDLLRQMNDFAAAQIIYENLIHSFPEHPQRYLAELSRAECMLALAKEDPEQLQNAAVELERLIDTPNLPVDFQVEIGFKWGFALQQSGERKKAQEVFALVSGRFLLDSETQMGATGYYWMSRVLLELGKYLEDEGNLAEARRVYRKMVAYNLPGRNLAQSRANRLLVIEE
jgi:cellulose synthase operon protein C